MAPASRGAETRETRRLALLAFLLAVGLRLHSLDGGFIWDDRAGVVQNRDAHRHGTPLREILGHDFWGQDMRLALSHKSYRPLTVLTFRLNAELHGETWALGFRLFNLALHGLNAALWAMLLRVKWRCELSVAAGGALLFALHPIPTECICSVVGRADLLAATFAWLGLWIYPDTAAPSVETAWRVGVRFGMAVLLAAASALSKETGVTVLGLFVCYEAVLSAARAGSRPSLGEFWCATFRQPLRPGCVLRVALCLGSLALYVAMHLRLHGAHRWYPWTPLENDISLLADPWDRARSYAFTHGMYLFKLLWPARQSFDYGLRCLPVVTSSTDPHMLLPLGAYAFLAVCAAWGLSAPDPGILWLGALLVLPWLPASQLLVPVGVVLGERLLYMPCAAMAALVARALRAAVGPPTTPQLGACLHHLFNPFRGSSGWQARGARLLALAAAAALARRSIVHSHVWRREDTLFASALHTCPDSVKVLSNVGFYHLENGSAPALLQATELLERAVAIYPNATAAHENLGLSHFRRGRFASARRIFRNILAHAPDKCNYWLTLQEAEYFGAGVGASGRASGVVSHEERLERLAGALSVFESAVRVSGCDAYAPLYHSRSLVALALGQFDEAAAFAEGAAARNSASPILCDLSNTFNMLGLGYKEAARADDALFAFERALGYKPTSWEVLTNLATLHLGRQLPDSLDVALSMAQRADRLRPGHPEVLTNLGFVRERRGELREALRLYEQAYEAQLPTPSPQIARNYEGLKERMGL